VIETTAAVHEGYALPAPGYGIKAGIHRSGSQVDPDALSTPDSAIVARISAWIEERLPDVDPEPIHTDTCLYTSTAEEHFVFERHGRVVVGSACSGRGFKFAPLTGQLLAELAGEVL
jgi:sarcosine oxidase